MTLSISTNIASMTAQGNQVRSENQLATAIARLSSGLRINSAADDAAGLAIADRFTAQIEGTTQAGRNANDGISLAQTADGALASIDDNLQRMRELAVQSANATNSASDRASLQLEVTQLQSEIDRVATQTQFNGIDLLDGSFAGQAFQIGANAGQTIAVSSLASARTGALGTHRGVALSGLGPPLGAGVAATVTFFALAGGVSYSVPIGTYDGDASALAAGINTAGIPGLSAKANATNVAAGASTANASASGTATLTVNGVQIAIAGTSGAAGLAGNRVAAVAAINAQSAATGVTANDTGSGVALLAADGRNVNLAYSAGTFTGSNASDFGLTSASVTSGTFNFDYAAAANVTFMGMSFSSGSGGATAFGFSPSTIGTPISAVDISTATGANTALTSIDAALASIDAERASLGAVQNRFTSTIANLQSSGESLDAARSRIEDADFATETANLSRAQVLQQAGTAMIAQANQLPTQVLSLLRSG